MSSYITLTRFPLSRCFKSIFVRNLPIYWGKLLYRDGLSFLKEEEYIKVDVYSALNILRKSRYRSIDIRYNVSLSHAWSHLSAVWLYQHSQDDYVSSPNYKRPSLQHYRSLMVSSSPWKFRSRSMLADNEFGLLYCSTRLRSWTLIAANIPFQCIRSSLLYSYLPRL